MILNVAYGWQVTSNDDYFVRLMEEAFSIHNAINKPGGWLVEFLPIRRFLRTLELLADYIDADPCSAFLAVMVPGQCI